MPYTPEQFAAAMNPQTGGQQVAALGAPIAPQPPDFLAHFLQNILGPAIAAQNQQGQNRLQFKRDAVFGRHLGMDGQPIAETPSQPMAFGDLRRNPADIANAERQTFGRSFTAGERNPGWTGDQGTVIGRDPNTWVSGPSSAWNQEPGGGYSMLNHGQQNPWSFGTMAGSYMPAGQQGPMRKAPRMF